MERNDQTPLWVFLAFSSIKTRTGALWIIWVCAIFTIYCLPWGNYFDTDNSLLEKLLIDDWSWFATMVPVTLWYWASLVWMDKNAGWKGQEQA